MEEKKELDEDEDEEDEDENEADLAGDEAGGGADELEVLLLHLDEGHGGEG